MIDVEGVSEIKYIRIETKIKKLRYKNLKILYGTTNNAKLNAMRNATDRLGIELIGLKDLHCELPVIIEDGKTPVENAKIKAQAYYKAFGMPVFSCDSGLYFEGVMEEDQPGLFVRRVNGKELSDDEMITHYAGLAEKYGGSLIARYYNAVHFILDDNTSFSSMKKAGIRPFFLFLLHSAYKCGTIERNLSRRGLIHEYRVPFGHP